MLPVDNGNNRLAPLTSSRELATVGAMKQATPTSGFRRDPLWNFRTVGAFMPKATAKACEKHGFHAAEIILNWSAIVGPELARFTAPRRIRWPKAPTRDNETTLPDAPPGRGVKSALEMWVDGGRAHEIPYLKGPIIARINTYFGYRAITDILPVSGPINTKQGPLPRIQKADDKDVVRMQAKLALPADDPLSQSIARLGALMEKRRARRG